MEIIKQGTKNRVECGNCGALLSYTIDDIVTDELFVSQRDSYTQRCIICPQCNNKIVLEGSR